MKIKIKPLTSRDLKELKQLAEILEDSEVFTNFVSNFRAENCIPKDGYSNDEDYYKNPSLKYGVVHEDAKSLIKELGLPRYWTRPIEIFLTHNILYSPSEKYIEIFPSIYGPIGDCELEDIPDYKLTDDKHVIVYIEKNISKRQLHKFIDLQWERIDFLLSRLPNNPTNKMKRTEIAKEVVDLRDIQKYSFKKISKILQDKHVDNLELYDFLNEDNLKILYHRWKKKINSFSNTS